MLALKSCQEEVKSFAEASGLAICKTSARSGQGAADRGYRARVSGVTWAFQMLVTLALQAEMAGAGCHL